MAQYTTPNNTNEWVSYILNEIPAADVIHQSRIAGSNSFLRTLKEEGYTAQDLEAINKAIALRYGREGMRIPMKMHG